VLFRSLEELPSGPRRHKAGMLRFVERLIVGEKLKAGRPVFEKGSPWHRVGPDAPPFFVIHGAMDTLALVDEARAFVDRLRRASREPVAYAELPHAQHAFDQFLSIRTVYTVRAIARFGEWAFARSKVSRGARPEPPRAQALPGPTSTS